jgi:hypothetical protein
VVVAWLGLGGGLLVVCGLGGCSAQPLGPTRDAGDPRRDLTAADAGRATIGDGGAATTLADGAALPQPAGAAIDSGAGAPSGPPVRLAPTTVLSPGYLLPADALAADADGIYWVTPSNQLWMLPTGTDSPRELASESTGPPAQSTSYPGVLLAGGEDLFWVSKVALAAGPTRQIIHRTRKSGGDDILVTSLQSDSVQGVAVDDDYLYWTQDLSPGSAGGAQILALPREADPGTTPVLLATIESSSEAFSLAVDDQYLYWTPWAAIGSTVYRATVWRGDKAGLLDGTTPGAPFVDLPATFLWPYGGALYFVYSASLSTSDVGRADAAGGVTTLSVKPGWLTFFGDCVVSSTAVAGMNPQAGFIYGAPLATVGNPGAAGVEIAANVAVPPVVGVSGLVFVDGTGQLLAISAADVRASLAAGTP